MIDALEADRVILVPVAVDSTKAEDWDVGTMSTRKGVAYRMLAALGITADAVPFQLGESDGLQGTTTAAWAASMNSSIASPGQKVLKRLGLS